MKKCLFIINPLSGQHIIQNKLDTIIGKLILKEVINYVDVFYTKGKDDGYTKAKSLSVNEYDLVVAVGGDGTINEVISGIIDGKNNIPVALLAAGTVNDFAHYLKLPTDVDEIVKMINDFKTFKCDVGKINDDYFVNVVAGGMFSDVSFVVSKEDKRRFGPFAYYLNGLINLPSQLNVSIPLKITINNEEVINQDAKLFLITNTHCVGGFKYIAPYADVQDSLLDLIIIKQCSITDLISLYKDYKLSKHLESPFLIYRQAKSLKIESSQTNIVTDYDGEIGPKLPIEITNIPNAIEVLIPKND